MSYSYPESFLCKLESLMNYGKEVKPRGMLTKELLHSTFVVDPKQCLFTSPIRNLNFFFLIAENMWYLSGRNTTEIPSRYVNNYRNFSDEGIHQGAYGPMIMEQIRYVINNLKKDKDSRQAVMSIWRPNPSSSKDTPCTLIFHFMIRDDKLNMHITMRSNDIIWGSNYDIPSFSMIQHVVAGILGIKTGQLFLTASSLHVYEKHFDLADKLIKEQHHRNHYPKVLDMIDCEVNSLEHHMKCMEEVLTAHYYISNPRQGYERLGMLPNWYKQYVEMILLHKAIKYDKKEEVKRCIDNLMAINSPFGIIYRERLKDIFS